ncbi:Crp/Fnr family transcriptional regulator [Nitratireductor luteus]|uniref:Crp/Fnr family transcriptional regulator n=1 Tax=Nitratireductor luteus TaxID=2976980 RepID=UPI00223ED1F6|nr:Crp/Fnr family transcriptional regulator [Nitratireductor luteus]
MACQGANISGPSDSPDNDAAPRPARLRPDQFERLFGGCRPEHHSAGKHLFMQEDASDRIYGVLSGTIEISIYSPGGRKLVANIELTRSLVGEIGVLDGGARTASALCLTDCVLVSLSRAQLFERLEKNASLALAMIGLLCARLRWVSGERNDQALLKIEARLAKRLLFLSRLMADGDGWIPISQSELAAFLGATRESVNKILNEWRGRSLIATKRGAIRVSNARGLQEIVDLEEV